MYSQTVAIYVGIGMAFSNILITDGANSQGVMTFKLKELTSSEGTKENGIRMKIIFLTS